MGKVYLQEPRSLNKKMWPQLQEFKCYHVLSGGVHFPLSWHALFISL